MHASSHPPAGFKRQVVFRIGAGDWPLLQAAAAEHGSLQAALLVGLRALRTPPADDTAAAPSKVAKPATARPVRKTPKPAASAAVDAAEEMRTREAAQLLGLKTSTVSGYIRSGRLPGRYDGNPTWRGWLTTRGAVDAYLRSRSWPSFAPLGRGVEERWPTRLSRRAVSLVPSGMVNECDYDGSGNQGNCSFQASTHSG